MASYQPIQDLDQLDAAQFIIVSGARVNNLKNLSVAIPRNKLVVITGLSGSGKTSLAFDTIFAEGQRMYIESLSAYVRQFLGKLEKPAVDSIRGLSPAIAIEQKVHHSNPRSTVGTITEIYDYLKLLYARIGITYSPISGQKVTRDTISDVVDYIGTYPVDTQVMVGYVLDPVEVPDVVAQLKVELGKGFTRIIQDNRISFIEEVVADPGATLQQGPICILVDRFVISPTNQDDLFRITDSIQTAFFEGQGKCYVEIVGQEKKTFSDRFEQDGMAFEVPSINLFSFNNPYGACKTCDGLGKVMGIDTDKIIPNRLLSVYEGAIHPWRAHNMAKWLKPLLKQEAYKSFPIHRPYKDLSPAEQNLLWQGDGNFQGILPFFEHLKEESHTLSLRIFLSRYRGVGPCPACHGARLRQDATYVKVSDRSITDLYLMPITEVAQFFNNLSLPPEQEKIAERLLLEIKNRLSYMEQVGLGYLSLVRQSSTLSGGEYQRIKLATALGSTLVDTLYILDEPTIGLHPRDTQKLIKILLSLRNMGNTVIVVEHEEEVIKAADQLIDIGPEAGAQGGELVFQGDWQALQTFQGSYTARYLNGIDSIPLPARRRKPKHTITFKGIMENNLKEVDLSLPLGVFTVITGVSGSGKSTLVKKIIYPALASQLGVVVDEAGKFDSLEGDFYLIQHLELVDQHSIGKSARSNPVTYVKAYDYIRQLFAAQPLAKERGYTPGHFSFNTVGGRCETCQGEGKVLIDMQFMTDISLTCAICEGKRFKDEVLEIKYKERSIAEVLLMTVDDASFFFNEEVLIYKRLKCLRDVGLGYVPLGQPSSLLSGGEAQRLKLATYLLDRDHHQRHTLFILDEPTTGLHVHDISKLITTLQSLVEAGHTVLVIEHTMELIKCADWIIDLGPEGGEQGGRILFSGPPEALLDCPISHTARYLKEKLINSKHPSVR